jgi:hypothetical protein
MGEPVGVRMDTALASFQVGHHCIMFLDRLIDEEIKTQKFCCCDPVLGLANNGLEWVRKETVV